MELEMRIVKKVAAAAMAMAVVFGAASLKACCRKCCTGRA